ncbi:hypothetical protein MLD38_018429 [Melastoma candidum]|uniref:Uncharacterized protein n=1 Tax=Melastoma candidum TaxID=119954 RepID=A0ACB9R227_9MYRT|nr:hypothetical protein MLD38_018429 [Melastoma candidum]
MSAASPNSRPSDSLSLSSQPHHPVHIVAAPGVTEPHFRSAVESSLFRNWVKNLEGDGGVLANGAACLKQVVDLFGNRIGFLKLKADIFDNKTGKRVWCLPEDRL